MEIATHAPAYASGYDMRLCRLTSYHSAVAPAVQLGLPALLAGSRLDKGGVAGVY